MYWTGEIARFLKLALSGFLLIASMKGSNFLAYFQGSQNFWKGAAIGSPRTTTEIGKAGGTLTVSQHSEPKTLNPLIATDVASRDVIGLMMSDLIHINRSTLKTEPALATSWAVSSDGRRYTLYLRRGIRFSDGSPFSADDVVFSWLSYLDQRTNSPQRDLLTMSGQPIRAQKVNQYTVEFTLPHPYAAAERLFDGLAILPRHVLQERYEQGTLASAWGVNAPPERIVGLGPFRLKQYIPGQHILLERNPYYWKKDSSGHPLPYLNSIVSVFSANGAAEALRFDAGETDVISRLSPADFTVLQRDEQSRHFRLYDLGPGLEYAFLFFNENRAPTSDNQDPVRLKQSWFQRVEFRRAISSAINRADLVRLAYRNRADPLAGPVTPGNKLWIDHDIPPPAYSLSKARELIRACGFSWEPDGSLVDSQQHHVEFSILVNAANSQQVQLATLIQHDLGEIGVRVTLDEMEFHTFLSRIFTTYKYEAALMALADGDADPNSELNVLSSDGSAHVWALKPADVIPAWQRDIDHLMQDQLIALNYQRRKRIYDQVQEIIWEHVPVIYLISPHILVGAKDRVGNFYPAILGNYALWNADQLFIRQ